MKIHDMYIDEKLIAIKNNKAYKKQCKWNLYEKKNMLAIKQSIL